MELLQLAALPLMVEALFLMLMCARGGMSTTKFGAEIQCEVEGIFWRAFGLAVSAVLIYVGFKALSGQLTSTSLVAAAAEAGVIAMVAISEGRFKLFAYDISCSERSTVARVGLSAFVLLLLFPELVFRGQPTAIAMTLLGFAGLAFLNATTDELSIPGMNFPEQVEPPYAFRVMLALGGAAFVAVAIAISKPAVAKPEVATAEPARTAPTGAPSATSAPAPRWHWESYVQLASEPDEMTAGVRATEHARTLGGQPRAIVRASGVVPRVCVFRSKRKGMFGVVLGPLNAQGDAAGLVAALKKNEWVPKDALVVRVDDTQLGRCYPLEEGERADLAEESRP